MSIRPSATASSTSPLGPFERRHGARFASGRGDPVAMDYGSPDAEYHALRAGCGLVVRRDVARLAMSGEDRARFLNGLVTCDVQSLEPGRGIYGFVTSVKGRVLADVTVLACDSHFQLELPAAGREDVAAHLQKYAIIDRVELRPLDGEVSLGIRGPSAAAGLEAAGLAAAEVPAEAHSHLSAELCAVSVRIVRESAAGDSFALWVPEAGAGDLAEGLLAAGAGLGLMPVGAAATERLRIESGQPRFGVDYGPENFPQETGLEELAVSYTKGCYLGQEVVARIHYRGGVNRHLRGLVFDHGAAASDAAARLGRELRADGRVVGTVTSAAFSAGRPLGLAILHRRAEPGRDVEVEGGGRARVVELPFADAGEPA